MTSCLCYFPILYVRSPPALLDDSIFSPPLLPRMLTKPRTVCGCRDDRNPVKEKRNDRKRNR